MCDANGMTEDLLARRGPDAVQHVEMFMFNYPRLDGLRLFVNLTSLSVMQQNLTAIEGLDQCVHLRQLWVVECKVRAIEGLDALIHLERLYLYSNQLRAIANLERLAKLHTLWLCDNQISVVEGLASCFSAPRAEPRAEPPRALRRGFAPEPRVGERQRRGQPRRVVQGADDVRPRAAAEGAQPPGPALGLEPDRRSE